MPDWTKNMQQYFEYYVVDPNTWMDERRLDNIISSTVVKDEYTVKRVVAKKAMTTIVSTNINPLILFFFDIPSILSDT